MDLGPNNIKTDLFVCLKAFEFFFTSKNMDYFNLEKLIVFFILYSNAQLESKVGHLFELIASEVPAHAGYNTQMIINNNADPTIHRIFAYMAIITCLITTEVLRGQDNLDKGMKREGLEELDEKYQMCSSQTILNNYTAYLRNGILFKKGWRREPITLDSFMNMFNASKNLENETNFIFIDP